MNEATSGFSPGPARKDGTCFTRRHMLLTGGMMLGSAYAVAGGRREANGTSASGKKKTADKRRSSSPGFRRYEDLLSHLEKKGHRLRVLGYAPDLSPVVAVKAGGKKKPALFISAGSHSTEHAGVVAAVELLEELQTTHEVYVLPCRDPVGLSGFVHALSLSLGPVKNITSVEKALALLRQRGHILYEKKPLLLAQIGEYGYASGSFYRKFSPAQTDFLEPLKGRRLYFPSTGTDKPGAGPLERAYTQIVTPGGEVLHLNRFHDTPWAPVEVQCARQLMAEIRPALTFDLHEYGGKDFWMSARRQRSEEDQKWELRFGREAMAAVKSFGATFPAANYRPGSFFHKLQPGLFLLEPKERGEGLNLVDFAALKYGPGFTVETGMRQDFRRRVQMHKTVVKTVVRLFEERYA